MANKYIDSIWSLRWSDILSETVKIEYSVDGGEFVTLNISATNHNGPEFGQGYYNWIVDIEPSNNVVIRISDNDYPDMYVDFDPVDIIIRQFIPKIVSNSFKFGFRF